MQTFTQHNSFKVKQDMKRHRVPIYFYRYEILEMSATINNEQILFIDTYSLNHNNEFITKGDKSDQTIDDNLLYGHQFSFNIPEEGYGNHRNQYE